MDTQAGDCIEQEAATATAVYKGYEEYDFQNDSDFRAGLPTIMARLRGSKLRKDEIDELIERAQWFFYAQVHPHPVQWEDYKTWRSRTAAAAALTSIEKDKQATERIATLNYRPAAPNDNDGDQPLSFARLCELISQGRTNEIPGVKDIPEDLNDAPPSVPIMQARVKPWEQQSQRI